MRGVWRPGVVAAAIVVGTFLLAKAHVFEPSATEAGSAATGDPYSGELVFERECAGCHGPRGEGGAGPRLEGSKLGAQEIALRIRQGSGVMPAGLVSGEEEANVVAYVLSIAGS